MVGATPDAVGGPFQFMPPNVTASNGTVVTFIYSGSPGNHTVAQSTLDNPCQPMSGGFDSGFILIPTNTTSGFPTWNLTITNDQERELFVVVTLTQKVTVPCQQSTSTARSCFLNPTAPRAWLGKS